MGTQLTIAPSRKTRSTTRDTAIVALVPTPTNQNLPSLSASHATVSAPPTCLEHASHVTVLLLVFHIHPFHRLPSTICFLDCCHTFSKNLYLFGCRCCTTFPLSRPENSLPTASPCIHCALSVPIHQERDALNNLPAP